MTVHRVQTHAEKLGVQLDLPAIYTAIYRLVDDQLVEPAPSGSLEQARARLKQASKAAMTDITPASAAASAQAPFPYVLTPLGRTMAAFIRAHRASLRFAQPGSMHTVVDALALWKQTVTIRRVFYASVQALHRNPLPASSLQIDRRVRASPRQ